MKRQFPQFLFLLSLFFLLTCGQVHLFSAQPDPIPACQVCQRRFVDTLLKNLQRLDAAYAQYRWVEYKIRLITYDGLWKAREDALDPLSTKVRKSGRAEEKKLRLILKGLDESVNQLLKILNVERSPLSSLDSVLPACCDNRVFPDCVKSSLKPVVRSVAQLSVKLNNVIESERDYRKTVDLAAAGRAGLYPEDAVEESIKHTDLFDRYERERSAAQFQDDREMLALLLKIEKQIRFGLAEADCCYQCQLSG